MLAAPLSPSPVRRPAFSAARWIARTQPNAADLEVARQCQISPVTAAILRERGYVDAAQVCAFFDPSCDGLLDPFDLPDIEPAIARLHQAIQNGEQIWVFGDYDVDGVTSAALLTRALRAIGASVVPRIPERHEGYGLNPAAVDEAKAAGASLILSADCGITAHEAAAHAAKIGLDLIITDHHEPDDTLPQALAVINPKRADSVYGFRELSGCGVAFKVMQALLLRHWPKFAPSFQDKFVELVALAAVADCVPLVDENRILAREGLKKLAQTNKLGLKELIRSAGLKVSNGSLTGRQVGFSLAPRLNAAGRMASPRTAFNLLMATDLGEAAALAAELEERNKERQELTRRIFEQAIEIADRDSDWDTDMLAIVVGPAWPRGVVGLVANRLTELYGRPAIVLSCEKGVAHGSGRSVGKFDLHSILDATRDLLTEGGGHQAACGLTLDEAHLPAFRERALQVAADGLRMEDLVLAVEADCAVRGRDVSVQLAREFEKLEPCGAGNHEPRLLLYGARLLESRPIGKTGDHLSWSLEADGRRFSAVWWSPGERAADMAYGSTIDLVFVPEMNHWKDNVSLRLNIKEARRSDAL